MLGGDNGRGRLSNEYKPKSERETNVKFCFPFPRKFNSHACSSVPSVRSLSCALVISE